MIIENPINYYDQRFVKVKDDLYIRQIKRHWYGYWKTVVFQNTKQAISFTNTEVNSFWRGKTFETFETPSDLLEKDVEKYTKYDLI